MNTELQKTGVKRNKVLEKILKDGAMVSTIFKNNFAKSHLVEYAKSEIENCVKKKECKIRIIDGVHSGGLKECVAISVEDYLKIKVGSSWETGNINHDVNSEDLAGYLNSVFPNEAPWVVNHSQSAFDIYSLSALVAVELKSLKASKSKRSGEFSYYEMALGNATLYPTEARIRDVVPKNTWQPGWSKLYLNTLMDVLVVFAGKYKGRLVDFRIVDGSFWGASIDDYVGCRESFREINDDEITNEVIDIILRKFPDNVFLRRMRQDAYNNRVKLAWRKLLSYRNPLNEVF